MSQLLEIQEGVTHGLAAICGPTVKTHNNLLYMMNFSRSCGYSKCKRIGDAAHLLIYKVINVVIHLNKSKTKAIIRWLTLQCH